MLGGATGRFTDPDDYRANLPDVTAQLVVTQGGAFDAQLTWAKLPNVRLMRAQEALARTAYIALPASGIFVSFSTRPSPGLVWNGVGLAHGELVFHRRGELLHQRTTGCSHWGFLSVAPAFFARYGSALAGGQLAPPTVGRVLRPSPADLTRLLRLHARIGRLVETSPVRIARPEIGRAMEQQLLHALVVCLIESDVGGERTANPRHLEIMCKLEAVLAAQRDSVLTTRELCATVLAHERTLRLCCRAFVGMSPSQYLRLRRLNLARAAMLASDPSTTHVADIARRFGFQEAGRFAASYRLAFGEHPSTTLGHLRNPQLS